MFERIYNQQERLNHEAAKRLEDELHELILQLNDNMEKGILPEDPKTQELMKRFKEINARMSLGGLEVSELIKNDYKEPEIYINQGLDPKISEYISRAMSAH